MLKTSDKLRSGLKLTAIMVAASLATGCISAKTKPGEQAMAAEPAKEAVAAETMAEKPMEASELTSYTVLQGNHLWGISAQELIFNLAEMWPGLYRANMDQIKDPDLIYAGQVLKIPRGTSQDQIDRDINHAKNRGAWALGAIEPTDTAYF